jgi:HEAT repeat protein
LEDDVIHLRLNDPLGRHLWVARLQASLGTDPDPWLAELTQIEHLVEKGDRSAADHLIDLLQSYSDADQEAARTQWDAYLARRPSQRQDIYHELACVAKYALIALGSTAREPLLRAYRGNGPDTALGSWLLSTLVEMEDPELEGFFRQLAGDARTGERARYALETIQRKDANSSTKVQIGARLDPDAALEHYLAGLRDENYFHRWRAAEGLAELADPRAADSLKRLRNDPNEYVRMAVEHALARLAGSKKGDDGFGSG